MNQKQKDQFLLLEQSFTVNGVLSPPTPPSISSLEKSYKILIYKKMPNRKKPITKRNLLRFLVSKEAKRLNIEDALVIGKITDMLFQVAASEVQHQFRNLAAQLKSRRL